MKSKVFYAMMVMTVLMAFENVMAQTAERKRK